MNQMSIYDSIVQVKLCELPYFLRWTKIPTPVGENMDDVLFIPTISRIWPLKEMTDYIPIQTKQTKSEEKKGRPYVAYTKT